jgi:anti-sigma factor RsiW
VEQSVSCSSVRERLGAWHDGELGEPLASQVAAHVLECPLCTAQLARLCRLDELLGCLPQPAPVDLAPAVRDAMGQHEELGWAARLAVAAAVAAGLALGVLAGWNGLLPQERPLSASSVTLQTVAEVFAPAPDGGLGALTADLKEAASPYSDSSAHPKGRK